jgi:hypothetical protein
MEVDSVVTKQGWVIHLGDTVRLGSGKKDDGTFKSVKGIGWMDDKNNTGHQSLANGTYYVYQVLNDGTFLIRRKNIYGVGNDKLRVYYEQAIEFEELEIPDRYKKKETATNATSRADELTKLKKLLDDGVLTKEEFEAEKKKLLEN